MPVLSTSPAPSSTQGGPGPQGPPGAPAYTYTAADVVNYDGKSNLTVFVQDVSWVAVTSPVFIPKVGTLEVTAIDPAAKTLTLLPLKTDIGTYPYTIPQGTLVASSGYPGLNGATGNTGQQGPIGPQGPPGPQGLQGPAGTVGATGATGPQGNPGVQGATGSTGATGATGPIGPQGPIGVKGDQGPTGIQGIQGPQGPQGQQGVTGPTGPQGIQGPPGPAVTAQGLWNPSTVYAQGDLVTYGNLIYIGLRASQNAQPDTHPQDWAVYSSVGIQGPSGPPGQTGAAGAQGPQGVPGPQGPEGADGATGATGAVGPVGPKGDTGSQGPQGQVGATGPVGPTGPQGIPGTGAVWRGNWTSAATYSANDAVFRNGSSYVALSGNTNQPPESNPTTWQMIAQQGAQGIQGPVGPTGPTGPTGAASTVPGPQGPTGPTGPPGPTAVSGDAGNTAMLGSDNRIYVPTLALATTTKIGALNKITGNTTDFLDGTNNFQNLAAAVQPTIWSVRLRSFNAIGNPTFEVDQRNVFTARTTSGFVQDKWFGFVNGISISNAAVNVVGSIPLPGTSFAITRSVFRCILTAQKTSLGVADSLGVMQYVEGPQLRELITDVHSVSILCRGPANLSFALFIRDSASGYTLSKLCTLGPTTGWYLITLPNLPVWTASGSFPITPGNLGYTIGIGLVNGSNLIPPANDVWQTGNFTGAVGQSNFAASPVNSSFDIAFIQHEPGALCTTLIDKPFTQNLDECLRFYTKSYSYPTIAGSVASAGAVALLASSAQATAVGPLSFKKIMAKVPTVTIYNHATGAANSVQDQLGTNHANAAAAGVGDSGFFSLSFTTATTSAMGVFANYTADTGW